jgi:D-serine deaminase-like pyridoxal phosphate-dependent protein
MSPSDSTLIGLPIAEIDTPALVIDLDVMERNIEKMAEYFKGKASNLRPHFKTHKCVEIMKLQLAAGAVGSTCAKVEEAEVLVDGGVTENILIANQIVTKHKISKLMALNQKAEVMVCVDNPENVNALAAAAVSSGVKLGVFVEVDIGMSRCGVNTVEEAVTLAKQVYQADGLIFKGLQGYEGHLVHLSNVEERKAATHKDLQKLLDTKVILMDAGIEVGLIDSGGTGTYNITGDFPQIDEIQAGSYLFGDVSYLRVLQDFSPSLTLLTTVVSRCSKELIITDMGLKAASTDQALPEPISVKGLTVRKLAEEHCYIDVKNTDIDIKVGDQISLIPGHVCTTVNLHDRYIGVRNGRVEVVWPITGRGKFR